MFHGQYLEGSQIVGLGTGASSQSSGGWGYFHPQRLGLLSSSEAGAVTIGAEQLSKGETISYEGDPL